MGKGFYLLNLLFICSQVSFTDQRAYQHGIDFIPLGNGKYYLIWASSGIPPTGEDKKGNWTHNIYYSKIISRNIEINPVKIIGKAEAQEPASSAISSDGRICITMEDGWNVKNGIAQRFGIYDTGMNPIKPYPIMVLDGGHSGHTAAVKNRFIIFYSNGWVDGGGVDNLGTGDDVLAKIYTSSGKFIKKIDIAVSKKSRDWWPLIAGSDTTACLIWQRFIKGKKYSRLMCSIIDPAEGKIVKANFILENNLKYYTYSVEYIPELKYFIIFGAYKKNGGFVFLIDQAGNVINVNRTIPSIVRESRPIISKNRPGVLIAQPISPSGLMLLSCAKDGIIKYEKTLDDSYVWGYSGTDGIFVNSGTVYIVSLSPEGLVEKTFNIPE